MLASSSWPTHLALVARRLNLIGHGPSADTFCIHLIWLEVAVKTVAVALYAATLN